MIFTDKYRTSNMISWNINNICNFRCGYCNNWRTNNSRKHQDIDLIELKKGFDSIGKDWIIHISGGEPFLRKDFISICEMISKNHFISLNTNLSTPNVNEFADKIDPEKVLFISCSIHIEEREVRDPQLSMFIDKIKYLQNKHFNIIASYVADPSLFHRINEDFKTLELGGVKKIRLKTLRGVINNKVYPSSYSEKDIAFLSSFETDYPELEILNNQNSFYGLKCSAGTRFFVMDEIGNLKRCSSLQRKYGNLFKGIIKIDQDPKPCPIKYCGCPYEGIRNVSSSKSSRIPILKEILHESYLQLERIIKNPKLLLKLKDKLHDHYLSK